MRVNPIEYRDGALRLLDQTLLPHRIEVVECRNVETVAEAIRMLRVRGAPAIGVAAAYGSALAARTLAAQGLASPDFENALGRALDALQGTRPTAVNLAWALDRMRAVIRLAAGNDPSSIADDLVREARSIETDNDRANEAIGQHGAPLIPDGANVLTHCNTGALAVGTRGTALGVIRAAHESGKRVHVWVDETRPLLQGARLTTWELMELGIPCTLITDNMAAHFMARGMVDLAIVGADRIARNGDTANKIGTYGVAVLAHAHRIPFYVAAPMSTVDLSISSGSYIPIEERRETEVTTFGGVRVAPDGIPVANPAFDVTPAALVDAVITECGVMRAPYEDSLPGAATVTSTVVP